MNRLKAIFLLSLLLTCMGLFEDGGLFFRKQFWDVALYEGCLSKGGALSNQYGTESFQLI